MPTMAMVPMMMYVCTRLMHKRRKKAAMERRSVNVVRV